MRTRNTYNHELIIIAAEARVLAKLLKVDFVRLLNIDFLFIFIACSFLKNCFRPKADGRCYCFWVLLDWIHLDFCFEIAWSI